ncbi:NAD(P)-binding domain-containing protein [Dactylosporangium aurantiacum]|uniref:NAD(P)-binding domain-containing protein n=1 Tax=Dactylosporangium aurantiacum TaxID=35754 RepID=A0A9Q9MRE1_9ACTN|nr:NAD(P)-binding domain-containing protein [Dactylosporangium aurantiacum]MDG6110512.1 NAD(P)-binding domain-containing protein [Dactylosporangium aurantiacum]UWZ58422.1 NAD(P)-binding domain-containing protein [Dactylosporangium aurantiacum]
MADTSTPGGPRVCVIGAGACGLAAAQVLKERGIAFDVYERGSDLGGQWRFGNDSGTSAVYDSIELNSSSAMSGFPKLPMPAHYPTFPGHAQMLDYLERYAAHFGLRPHVRFRTTVTGVRPVPGGGYEVSTTAQDSRHYDAVVVASGFHWDPKPLPVVGGHFTGHQLHSKDYKTPADVRGDRVLVVGFGNTACDLATELSRVTDRVVMSVRRGFWVTPKLYGSRPLDRFNPFLARYVPMALQSVLLTAMLWAKQGSLARYGLPDPDHLVLRTHPATCEGFLPAVRAGRVAVRPAVDRFDGDRVVFADGTAEAFDTVLWCTGFRFSFPFLPPSLTPVMHGPMRLFRRIVMPGRPGLYFLGFVKPLSAITVQAEAQAAWIADLIDGTTVLPAPDDLAAEIAADERRVRRRYTATPRLTVEIDWYRYLRQLARDRRRLAAPAPTAAHPTKEAAAV